MLEQLKILTMDEVKAQIRDDYEIEDEILSLYASASEDNVIAMTGRTIQELNVIGYLEKYGETSLDGVDAGDIAHNTCYFPKPLKLAMLMLVGHLYKNREVTSQVNLISTPYGYDALVKPYKRLKKR